MRRLPLALSLALLVACQQATSPTSATPTAATAAATPAFAFEEATIAELQQKMQSGALTSHALVKFV